MANSHLHFHLLFLFLSFLFSPAISRHISPKTTNTAATSLFDVSTSLSRTQLLLSHSHQQQQQQQQQSVSVVENKNVTNVLSLRLHSRDLFPSTAPPPKDYTSLTLSRLARDSARVAAISARVALALSGIKNSDLEPQQTHKHETAAEEEPIEGPIASGSSQGSGEYFSRVGVGSPARQLDLVLDTGSDVSWVQCQPCADCYQQSDPIYDPSASSTYSRLDCASAACASLDVSACGARATCLYQVSYGDGSYTVGDFATETVTLGGRPLPNVAFGCGHDNEGLFVGAAGLLGLGGGALSFPSQISARSFSYCLVDRDSPSTSTLDLHLDLDGESASSGDAVSTSLIRNRGVDTFYYVGLTGIAVGGRVLPIPGSAFEMDAAGGGGVIVDSGTAITRLRRDAYDALCDAFVGATGDLARAAAPGVALFDTCYDLSSRRSVEVPTVGLMFGEEELRLPAKNYLIPVDSAGTFCLAFAPASSSSSGLSIIGNVQQQGTRVTFDIKNSMVGFEADKC
ncbi:putative protein ASPARTIC PROTEASE IN GUARD CELL 1 [Iris pallida]|uniref:Peptidase A1 domain-containing protein n=1 Tax=Iris pallida TaxID=29817 RepID=A0AAX6EGW9_IRIPA|nr:putative protein ASPARTIC PROTEASE IN GUARD CELL 1 [Iris pallida]